MKRKDIIKTLREAGFTFKEGGNHTLIYDPQGRKVSVIGRHNEIKTGIVRQIEKQTGVKLQ